MILLLLSMRCTLSPGPDVTPLLSPSNKKRARGSERVNYLVKCVTCGVEWWCRGDYEPDTNATNLDDSVLHEGECQCGDGVEIIAEVPEEFEDAVI